MFLIFYNVALGFIVNYLLAIECLFQLEILTFGIVDAYNHPFKPYFVCFQQLFIEAIQNGTMEGFYRLVSYFQTQSEPAYCGLASLSMVLNALAIDPGRKWKGTLIYNLLYCMYIGLEI